MRLQNLRIHVERIIREDPFFRAFWHGLDEAQRAEYWRTWEDIESAAVNACSEVDAEHSRCHDISKRWFVRVQEREFMYDRVPLDWSAFVRDSSAKQILYNQSLARLQAFLELCEMRHDVRLYGGIKGDGSLDKKLIEGRGGKSIQMNVLDLWDVVRFRIVVPSAHSLLNLCIRMWETYFDEVLRCRNYYFIPRNDDPDDPYRAINFELANDSGHMIEVQVMTKRREAVSLLDHAALFKKTLNEFTSDDHQWLVCFSKTANLLDIEESSSVEW